MILEKSINQSLLNIVGELKNQTKTLQGTIEGVLSDEMSETLEMTKRIASHGFEQGKNILKFFASSLALQKLQFKKGLIGDKKGGKGILGWLFDLLAPLGAAAGVLLHPFKTLGKIFKADWGIGKGFGVAKITGPIKTLFGAVKRFPLLGGSAKLLGKTFTKLFWPIQAVISTVEFIKGFMAGEDLSWKERIKNGMSAVVEDLVKLPAKLLGGAIDWAGKKMGFKMEGDEGQAIIDATMKSFDHWWDIVTLDFNNITKKLDKASGTFGFSTNFNEKYNEWKDKFDGWYNSLTDSLGKIKDKFFTETGVWTEKMRNFLNPAGEEGVWIDIPAILKNLKTSYSNFKNNLGKTFDDWSNIISDTWTKIKEFDYNKFFKDKLTELKNKILNFSNLAIEWIKDQWNSLVKNIPFIGDKLTLSETKLAPVMPEIKTAEKLIGPSIMDQKKIALQEEANKIAREQVELQKKQLEKKDISPIIAPNQTGSQIVPQKNVIEGNSNIPEQYGDYN